MKDYIKNRLYSDKEVFNLSGDFIEVDILRIDDENGKIVAFDFKEKPIDLIDLEKLAKIDDVYADIFRQIYEQKIIIDKIIQNEIDFEYIKKLILQKNITLELFKEIVFLKNYINNIDERLDSRIVLGYDFCFDFHSRKIQEKDNNLIVACNNSAEDVKEMLERKITREQLENQVKQKEAEYIQNLSKEQSIAPKNRKIKL